MTNSLDDLERKVADARAALAVSEQVLSELRAVTPPSADLQAEEAAIMGRLVKEGALARVIEAQRAALEDAIAQLQRERETVLHAAAADIDARAGRALDVLAAALWAVYAETDAAIALRGEFEAAAARMGRPFGLSQGNNLTALLALRGGLQLTLVAAGLATMHGQVGSEELRRPIPPEVRAAKKRENERERVLTKLSRVLGG